jgi:hypothetical protein
MRSKSVPARRAAAAPQWGQKRLPSKRVPKQPAQRTAASRVPQYEHLRARDEVAAAPQEGQWSAPAVGMRR